MIRVYMFFFLLLFTNCSSDKHNVELYNNTGNERVVSVFGRPKKEFNNGHYKSGDWENYSGSVNVKANTRIHIASTKNDSLTLKDLGFEGIKILSKTGTVESSNKEMLDLFKKIKSDNETIWEHIVN